MKSLFLTVLFYNAFSLSKGYIPENTNIHVLDKEGTQYNNEYIASYESPNGQKDISKELKRFVKSQCAEGLNVSEEFQFQETQVLVFKCIRLQTSELTQLTLSKDGASVSIEQNRVMIAAKAPANWGLGRIDQYNLPLDNEPFNLDYDGYGVTIYVIDTGINFEHAEFHGRVEYGKNLAKGGKSEDDNGHGTHCAGIAAGKTYGVAKGSRVFGVKVLGKDGSGTTADVIKGIVWAYNHAGNIPAVLSISIGGSKSRVLDAVVNTAAKKNIVVVAAGNERTNACKKSPSGAGGNGNNGGVITVGATNIRDQMAGFSNYGNCVDIYAPGVGIMSSWIGGSRKTKQLDGTSMSTPLVAGVSALLLQKFNLNKEKAQTELFKLVAKGKIKSLIGKSKNRLLQAPLDKTVAPAVPPTPFPTYGSVTFCSKGFCPEGFELSDFGQLYFTKTVSAEMVVPTSDMCSRVSGKRYVNKALLLNIKANSQSCTFFERVLNAEEAGAVLVVFHMNQKGKPSKLKYEKADNYLVTIPSGMITLSAAEKIKTQNGAVFHIGPAESTPPKTASPTTSPTRIPCNGLSKALCLNNNAHCIWIQTAIDANPRCSDKAKLCEDYT